MSKVVSCKIAGIGGDKAGGHCYFEVSEVDPLTKDPEEYYCVTCNSYFSLREYKEINTKECKCGKSRLVKDEICWYCSDKW